MSTAPLLVLTDRHQCAGPLADTVQAAVRTGARTVVLREKDLPEPERTLLAEELSRVLAPVDGLLVVAGRSGDHVHLAATDAFPDPRPTLVGRSCHDAAEVAAAATGGCDYVTVSPVFPTSSKPGYGPRLGLAGLQALITDDAPPVYALGGIHPSDVARCLHAGATGVAVMGPVMRTPALVADYLEAIQEVRA